MTLTDDDTFVVVTNDREIWFHFLLWQDPCKTAVLIVETPNDMLVSEWSAGLCKLARFVHAALLDNTRMGFLVFVELDGPIPFLKASFVTAGKANRMAFAEPRFVRVSGSDVRQLIADGVEF